MSDYTPHTARFGLFCQVRNPISPQSDSVHLRTPQMWPQHFQPGKSLTKHHILPQPLSPIAGTIVGETPFVEEVFLEVGSGQSPHFIPVGLPPTAVDHVRYSEFMLMLIQTPVRDI